MEKMRLNVVLIVFLCLSMILMSCSKEKTVLTKSGLKYTDIVEGTGTSADYGKTVVVNYKGNLPDGKEIDNSYISGKPLEFKIGAGSVIKGLNEGVVGMKTGGKRDLIIPPDLGYGADGVGSKIPGNTFLIFEVELIEVK